MCVRRVNSREPTLPYYYEGETDQCQAARRRVYETRVEAVADSYFHVGGRALAAL